MSNWTDKLNKYARIDIILLKSGLITINNLFPSTVMYLFIYWKS